MTRRLFFELVVILAAGGFAYVKVAPRWNGFFSPLKPAEEAQAPSTEPAEPLAAPPAAGLPMPSAKIAAAPAGSNMAVAPENTHGSSGLTYEGDPALKGDAAPKVFERAPIAPDSLALARPAPTSSARLQPAWLTALESLDPAAIVAGVVALFLVLYFIGVTALRRGPGGKGLTHD